jgi:uncharacterized protein YuzE
VKLALALPDFLVDLESALVPLGRGDLLDQLKRAELQRWTYDDFADTTYLTLMEGDYAERFSLYDEIGVNVDLDAHGRVCGIEILEGQRIAERLGGSPHGRTDA